MKNVGVYSDDYVMLHAIQLIDCKVNLKMYIHPRFKINLLSSVTLP